MSAPADNRTALTPEEIKAELQRRQDALEARNAAAKREAKTRLDMARKMSAARSKPGCITLPVIFCNRRASGKKGAAQTAAAGQGGGGDKKDPPEVIDVFPIVSGLAAHKIPGLEYEIISPTSIKIPARNTTRITAARKALEAAVTDADILTCKAELKEAQAIMGWFVIEQGKAVSLKTFERQAAKDLTPLYTAQLAAVEAVYQKFTSKKDQKVVERIELQCGLPVPLECPYSPMVMLLDILDLHQLPVQLPRDDEPYPGAMIAYFKDYQRSIEDEDNGRGCVVQKMFNNDIRESDYEYVPTKKDEPHLLKMTYRMGQDQEAAPGYPVSGVFGIQARFIEGGQADQKDRVLLRTAFGINNPKTWAALMPVNHVPAIIAGSISAKETQQNNPGRDFRKDFGTVCFFGNAMYVELREYLLEQCPQVSLAWVLRKLRIKGSANDDFIRFECNDPDYPCLLNKANTVHNKMDRTYQLVGGRVVNVEEFNGDIKGLMASSPTPCEFRVMHSTYLKPDERRRLATLDMPAAEKCLSMSDDALIRLDQPLTTVIYLVATMSEEEKEANAKAAVKWLERRKAEQAAAEAAKNNPRIVDADGNPMEEDDDDLVEEQYGGGDGKTTAEFPDEQDPDANVPTDITTAAPPPSQDADEELMQEALRRQIQEELDAASIPHGVKRTAPAAVDEVEAASQQQQQDDEGEAPPPQSARPTSRKTAPPAGTSKRRANVPGGRVKIHKPEQGDYE
jgi:hypothetical protein